MKIFAKDNRIINNTKIVNRKHLQIIRDKEKKITNTPGEKKNNKEWENSNLN